MVTRIDRQELQRLVATGAQLVDVLPRDEYDEEHLPGAIHLPLKELTAASASILDRGRPVIVYCWDSL
jgi:rhodanese-related sulfurtransferase